MNMFDVLKQGESNLVAAKRRQRASNLRQLPTVSYNSLVRAQTTLEDFCESYFHWHELTVQKDIFRLLPILVFVEATIYQMDEENEDMCESMASGETGKAEGEEVALQGEAALMSVLEEEGLLDERIREELRKGKAYWKMEREICARWARGEVVPVDEVCEKPVRRSEPLDLFCFHSFLRSWRAVSIRALTIASSICCCTGLPIDPTTRMPCPSSSLTSIWSTSMTIWWTMRKT